MKVYQSTSESLKIVLQIKRYIILTCKLLEKKNVLKPHCIKCHEFVIICEHMVLRRVWFIRCCFFCWCRGCCSNCICSAGCCCWVYRITQGNELIAVRVCKLSIKKISWLIWFLELTYLPVYHYFAVVYSFLFKITSLKTIFLNFQYNMYHPFSVNKMQLYKEYLSFNKILYTWKT